jgi:ankyrin repeat protein
METRKLGYKSIEDTEKMKVFMNKNLELISLISLARSSTSKSCNKKLIKELFTTDDINYQDEIGSTALIESTKKGNTAFRALCDLGADVNISDSGGLTSLMLASGKQIKILLGLEANRDAQTKNGFTALMFAVMRNDIRDTRKLVKNKANINIIDKYGNTALIKAAANLESLDSTKIINYLVKNGAVKNIINKRGMSALSYAILAKNKEMIKLLGFDIFH